jgi:phage shock protein PspC (stress-responsive transcriptional regulator)
MQAPRDADVPLRLVRRADHRLFAGVAGGLADHLGVRPMWIRLAFALSAFAGGIGIAAYLLLWFLIPRADLPRSAAQQTADRFPDAPAWIGLVLIGLGILSLADQLGLHSGAIGWAVLLIGVGFLLFQRSDERDLEGATSPSSPSDVTTAVLPTSSIAFTRRERRRRERSPLGWLTLGLALAAAGLVTVLRNTGAVELRLSQALAIPLAILGAGLLVGTLYGRARWTVLLGLPLVPLVMVTSAFTVPLTGPFGNAYVSEGSRQVRTSYARTAGDVTLDLSRIPSADLPATIDVAVGFGTVEIMLPPTGVKVNADVHLGYVNMDRSATGADVHGTAGDASASTVITVVVDVGQVRTATRLASKIRSHGGQA